MTPAELEAQLAGRIGARVDRSVIWDFHLAVAPVRFDTEPARYPI
jgi:hypothetical protein